MSNVTAATPVASADVTGTDACTDATALTGAIQILATGLRRALARQHGLHVPAAAMSGASGGIEWMSANAAPMVNGPGGDAASAMSSAGLHKQGGPAGVEAPTGPSHSEG